MADLQLFQGEYRGLIFGEGTPFVLDGPVNLWDTQTVRADLPLPRGDGAVALDDYLAPQDLVLSFVVWGESGPEAESNLHALRWAFRRTRGQETWMRFRTHERTWRVRTRPVRISAPYGYVEARSHMFKVKVQMARSDPRLYGDELRTARVPIYDPQAAIGSAGYELPEDLPFDVDSIVGVGGEILAANQGNDIAYPVLSVRNQGDTTLEKVTFVNLSAELTFIVETPLATGQTLVADMDALVRAAPGPHIHVDGTTRYSDWALPRIPWGLVGGTNRVRLLVEASDPFHSEDITARMTWRDTSA